MNSIDHEIELGYKLWVLAFERPEWFRNARETRTMLEIKRSELVAEEKKRLNSQ